MFNARSVDDISTQELLNVTYHFANSNINVKKSTIQQTRNQVHDLKYIKALIIE